MALEKRRSFSMGAVERLGLWQAEIDGSENLETARQHLEHGSILVAFNHSFQCDALYALVTCMQNFRDNVQHLLAPIAKEQFDLARALKNRRGDMVRNSIAFGIGGWLAGVELIPVIQPSDIAIYGREKTRKGWEYLSKYGATMLSKSGTVLLISPEGKRHDDGLQQGRRGFIRLWEKAGPNCLCLPLGVTLPKSNPGLNFRKKAGIRAGSLIRLQDMIDYSFQEADKKDSRGYEREAIGIFMKHCLAPLLPPEKQGIYRK